MARNSGTLSAEQARGFHEQMLVLSGLQLEFEAKMKQFGQTDFLGEDTPAVVAALGRIEDHLNQVLAFWEQSGWTIREGTSLAVVSDGLVRLFRVRAHLRPGVSGPMKDITRIINEQMFGKAREQTRAALEQQESQDSTLEDRPDGMDKTPKCSVRDDWPVSALCGTPLAGLRPPGEGDLVVGVDGHRVAGVVGQAVVAGAEEPAVGEVGEAEAGPGVVVVGVTPGR